jgi:hypothetical protein
MAIRPLHIEAPETTAPARFGLLDTFPPKALPTHGGMAGIEYDTEFCGVSRPWVAPCTTPADMGSISVSVDIASVATITGTGEPSGDYVVDWGDGAPGAAAPLDGQTHDYTTAGDGDYVVSVSGPDGYRATTTITVTNGVATGPFTADAIDTKVPDDGIEQATGEPIVIYNLFSCRLVGGVSLEDRAAKALESGASRAVEEGFGDVIGGVAVDVTPGGTPVGVIEGLALIEQEGGESYGGRRVIHADNAVVTVLISQGLVKEVDGHLETLLGSVVVSGPGYRSSTDVPSAPAAGAHWMYATGAVNVWADETIRPPKVIENPDTGAYDNEFRAIAERTFVPTYECFAVAVEVLLEA